LSTSRVLEIIDSIHRTKNIDRETVFRAVEAGLVAAAKQQYGNEDHIAVAIDRTTGAISAQRESVPLDPEVIVNGISAQAAKEIIIREIRAAERQ
jgi:N utilization substance protein A